MYLCGSMKKTKKYFAPEMRPMELASYEGFLTGSITDVKIKPDGITVQEFSNGFGDDGFKEISFD